MGEMIDRPRNIHTVQAATMRSQDWMSDQFQVEYVMRLISTDLMRQVMQVCQPVRSSEFRGVIRNVTWKFAVSIAPFELWEDP